MGSSGRTMAAVSGAGERVRETEGGVVVLGVGVGGGCFGAWACARWCFLYMYTLLPHAMVCFLYTPDPTALCRLFLLSPLAVFVRYTF